MLNGKFESIATNLVREQSSQLTKNKEIISTNKVENNTDENKINMNPVKELKNNMECNIIKLASNTNPKANLANLLFTTNSLSDYTRKLYSSKDSFSKESNLFLGTNHATNPVNNLPKLENSTILNSHIDPISKKSLVSSNIEILNQTITDRITLINQQIIDFQIFQTKENAKILTELNSTRERLTTTSKEIYDNDHAIKHTLDNFKIFIENEIKKMTDQHSSFNKRFVKILSDEVTIAFSNSISEKQINLSTTTFENVFNNAQRLIEKYNKEHILNEKLIIDIFEELQSSLTKLRNNFEEIKYNYENHMLIKRSIIGNFGTTMNNTIDEMRKERIDWQKEINLLF